MALTWQDFSRTSVKSLPFVLYATIVFGGPLSQLFTFTSREQRIQRLTVSDSVAMATFDTVWTRVRDVHFDSLMNGVDWDAVRSELRPRAARAGNLTQLRLVIRQMLARLGTSHYTLIPFEQGSVFATSRSAEVNSATGSRAVGAYGDAGLRVRFAGSPPRLVVTGVDSGSSAAGAGIQAGWRVNAVDGWNPNLSSFETAPSKYAARLARTRAAIRAQNSLRGEAGTRVVISLENEAGAVRTDTLVRMSIPGEIVRYGNLPPVLAQVEWKRITLPRGCAGVIRFNTWMPAVASRVDAAVDSVRACQGIVVDLRGNTGGVLNMVVGVAGHFLSSPDTLARVRTRTSRFSFVANPRMSTAMGARVRPHQGRLAILVDEFTGSTSEIFAGAMQSLGGSRVRLFGDTTIGQALPATTHALPSNDVLLYAVGDLTGPRGERYEGRGVIPDVVVPFTPEQWPAQGGDRVLDLALQWMGSAGQFSSRNQH